MIEIQKNYRLLSGDPARLYVTNGGGEYPVHGAYFYQGKWHTFSWSIKGEAHIGRSSELDLVEVKPRIQRQVWVNVYENTTGGSHPTKELADIHSSHERIACVKLTIDCEHGEGLE